MTSHAIRRWGARALCAAMIGLWLCGCSSAKLPGVAGKGGLLEKWAEFRRIYALDERDCALVGLQIEFASTGRVEKMKMDVYVKGGQLYRLRYPGDYGSLLVYEDVIEDKEMLQYVQYDPSSDPERIIDPYAQPYKVLEGIGRLIAMDFGKERLGRGLMVRQAGYIGTPKRTAWVEMYSQVPSGMLSGELYRLDRDENEIFGAFNSFEAADSVRKAEHAYQYPLLVMLQDPILGPTAAPKGEPQFEGITDDIEPGHTHAPSETTPPKRYYPGSIILLPCEASRSGNDDGKTAKIGD